MKCPQCGTDFQGNFCSNCGLKRNESTKRCPRCGTEYVGKFCSNCGYSSDLPQPNNKARRPQTEFEQKLGKVLVVIATISLIALIPLLTLLYFEDSSPSSGIDNPAPTTPTPTPAITPISISSADLLSAYDANEVNADDLYKGELLSVTGTINNIGKDIVDEVYITLGTGSSYELYSVQCYFTKDDEIDKVSELEKGETVTVVGKCDGKALNVQLKDCYIAEIYTNYSS